MSWYPGAVRKEITKWRTPINGPRGFVFHVAVSESSSLFGYFSGAQVCSHFYVRRDGSVEQYVDTRFRAPANYQGNPSLLSVETQGGVSNAQGEGWTEEQRTALAQLSKWVNETHGIPLIQMANSKSSSKGIGWHRQGIDPWRVSGGELWSTARGKICPGDQKIAEIPGIIAAAGGVAIPVDNGTPSTGNGGQTKNYLYVGDTGDAVVELQTLLTQAGYPTDIDGIFGKQTLANVRTYQASRGLVIDGYVGPETIEALRSGAPAVYVPPAEPAPQEVITLKRGSTGQNVLTLQTKLKTVYPSYAGKLVLDGIFGPATEAVVKEFQRRSGLDVDGIVGPKTQAALGLSFVQPGTPTPVPPTPDPIPTPPAPRVTVDGFWGAETTRALQELAGTVVDGEVWYQYQPNAQAAFTSGWVYNYAKGQGSPVIKFVQSKVGAAADGVWGAGSTNALEQHFGYPPDGVLSGPSNTIKRLQEAINAGTF